MLIDTRYKEYYRLITNGNKKTLSDNTFDTQNINVSLTNFSLISYGSDLFILYKIIDSPNKDFSIGNWFFYSLNEGIRVYTEYYGNSLFTIAYNYIGLGYYLHITYNLRLNCIIVSLQGGLNIYSKEKNYRWLINYNWLNTEYHMSIQNMLQFIKEDNTFWFNWIINSDNYNPYC